jgi:6-phosphofructokinase 1
VTGALSRVVLRFTRRQSGFIVLTLLLYSPLPFFFVSTIKSIGILTSGGDSPGMNAAIRALVRFGLQRGLRMIGVRHGYSGLIHADFHELHAFSVSNIIQQGGTILKTDRSKEFRTPEGRKLAAEQMRAHGIDALILIGGNGTFTGGTHFGSEHDIPIIGIPATIDNDLYGTDYTVGYDTAVNTAIYNIDKIRDTAESLERTFYIEVMGHSTGFLALEVGLACGAEYIVIPEVETDLDVLLELFNRQRATKRSNLIVVAEGDAEGGAFRLAERVKMANGMDYRVTILGHIQRGGSPTARDRILASRLGAAAIDALSRGERCKMVGEVDGHIVLVPLEEAWSRSKQVDPELLQLSLALAA